MQGYTGTNPGQNDHPHEDCNQIDFLPMDFDKHRKFAEMFGFEVTDLKWDNCDRIYAVWERSCKYYPIQVINLMLNPLAVKSLNCSICGFPCVFVFYCNCFWSSFDTPGTSQET